MNSKDIGLIIKRRRKHLGLRQEDISLSTGIGTRYISNLENGKPTCELGKALSILESLGLRIQFDAR